MKNSQIVINLLAGGVIGILFMILVVRSKYYSRLTRSVMDMLIALTIGAFLLVFLIVIAS